MRSSKSRSGIIHASPRTEARDRNGSSLTHHILERLPAREAPVVSGRVIGRGRRFALTEITGVEIPEEVLDADGVRTAIARIDGAVGQNPELAKERVSMSRHHPAVLSRRRRPPVVSRDSCPII